MRRLVVTENTSVDGVVSPMEGWFDPAATDADLLAASAAHRQAADALLLGRVTYEEFASYWPHQRDDRTGVSAYLDQVAKYVVSASLRTASWQHSTILSGPLEQAVGELKSAPGKDIVVTGSVSLVGALQRAGLVDLYRVFVYPFVQGHGRRLFDDAVRGALELVEARSFGGGVVLLEYRPR